jgi:dihydroxyacetone kinase-like predicted kinase
MGYVKTGQVTFAVRSTVFDDREINEGDILGLAEGKIRNTGRDVLQVTLDLIESMISEDDELITVLYGKDVSEDDANRLDEILKEKYSNCEIQLYNGGQPLYYFIISIE